MEKNMLAEAKRQANKSLRDVDNALKAGATTASAATAVLGKVQSDLDFADRSLRQVRKQVKDRLSEAKAQDKAKTKASADKKASDKKAVADWTCEFCDHKNPHDAKKCSNCGADRSKSK